jgi:hypothetical protein
VVKVVEVFFLFTFFAKDFNKDTIVGLKVFNGLGLGSLEKPALPGCQRIANFVRPSTISY